MKLGGLDLAVVVCFELQPGLNCVHLFVFLYETLKSTRTYDGSLEQLFVVCFEDLVLSFESEVGGDLLYEFALEFVLEHVLGAGRGWEGALLLGGLWVLSELG